MPCLTKTEEELEPEKELEPEQKLEPEEKPKPEEPRFAAMLTPWPDCPLVTLDEIQVEHFKMRLMSEGLCPDFDKPDAMTCAATVQRHREDHPEDTRVYSALITFGIREAHAKNQKKPRDGPKRRGADFDWDAAEKKAAEEDRLEAEAKGKNDKAGIDTLLQRTTRALPELRRG